MIIESFDLTLDLTHIGVGFVLLSSFSLSLDWSRLHIPSSERRGVHGRCVICIFVSIRVMERFSA